MSWVYFQGIKTVVNEVLFNTDSMTSYFMKMSNKVQSKAKSKSWYKWDDINRETMIELPFSYTYNKILNSYRCVIKGNNWYLTLRFVDIFAIYVFDHNGNIITASDVCLCCLGRRVFYDVWGSTIRYTFFHAPLFLYLLRTCIKSNP